MSATRISACLHERSVIRAALEMHHPEAYRGNQLDWRYFAFGGYVRTCYGCTKHLNVER